MQENLFITSRLVTGSILFRGIMICLQGMHTQWLVVAGKHSDSGCFDLNLLLISLNLRVTPANSTMGGTQSDHPF